MRDVIVLLPCRPNRVVFKYYFEITPDVSPATQLHKTLSGSQSRQVVKINRRFGKRPHLHEKPGDSVGLLKRV